MSGSVTCPISAKSIWCQNRRHFEGNLKVFKKGLRWSESLVKIMDWIL
jgi:hypothetical protein